MPLIARAVQGIGRRPRWVPAIAVMALVAILHLSWGEGDFQYDDLHSVTGNPHIRSLGNIPGFFVHSEMFSSHARAGMYRPLVLVTHAVNYALWADEAGGWRVTNVVIHAANSGLVLLVLSLFGVGVWPGVVGALAFGLHPVNVEVVAYISSRSESLCALFLLVSFLAYARATRPVTLGRSWLAVSAVTYSLALFSKEVGIVLPALLVLWEYLLGGAPGRVARVWCRRQWGHWLITAGYLTIVYGHLVRAAVDHPVRSMPVQLATQLKAWIYYAKLLCHPTGLTVEHQFIMADPLWTMPVLLAGLVGASCLWLATRAGLGRNVLFWAAWACVSLLPTSLVPLNVLVNEHRLYLASIAYAALIAWTMSALRVQVSGLRVGGLVAVIFLYGVLSAQRSAVWADAGSLWRDAVTKAPGMPRPHLFLADHYFGSGEYGRALIEYAQAESVYPEVLGAGDRLQLHNNRGATLLAMGRFAAAAEEYRKALRLDPAYEPSRDALEGLVALTQLERNPRAALLHRQGLSALIKGRVRDAVDLFRLSLEVQSWPETWLSLGLALERLGRPTEARSAYESLETAGRGTPFAQTARRHLESLGDHP